MAPRLSAEINLAVVIAKQLEGMIARLLLGKIGKSYCSSK